MVADTTHTTPRKPPKFLNRILSLILRSPLHSLMSNQIMLITFRGRKTGKLYTTPVGYVQQHNTLTLFTDHPWWKNLRDNAPATVRVKGKKLTGTAEVISDNQELIAEELLKFVQQVPRAAAAYGVKQDATGHLDPETVRLAAQRFTLVRIHLPGPG